MRSALHPTNGLAAVLKLLASIELPLYSDIICHWIFSAPFPYLILSSKRPTFLLHPSIGAFKNTRSCHFVLLQTRRIRDSEKPRRYGIALRQSSSSGDRSWLGFRQGLRRVSCFSRRQCCGQRFGRFFDRTTHRLQGL